jgi:hypothetical protein
MRATLELGAVVLAERVVLSDVVCEEVLAGEGYGGVGGGDHALRKGHDAPVKGRTAQNVLRLTAHRPKCMCERWEVLACMDAWMDGWMHACMHGWMDACMHGCMGACMVALLQGHELWFVVFLQ